MLSLSLRGTMTDLAYDAGTDRFVVTTQQGVYITDGSLSRVVRQTVVDPGYSVDLGTFAGTAFLDSHTIVAVADNKSFVVLKEADKADAEANFRYFLASPDQFENVSRSRFTTVRARLMYIGAVAYDPASDALFTVSLPNPKNRRLVVSKFDRKDMTLSEEFVPKLAADAGLGVRDKRSLDEYVVTGVAVAEGTLYALSAAHSTVLSIDPVSRRVVGARAVPGLDAPTGLAVKGNQFYIVNGRGQLVVAER
jgi:hypothetical protein